MPQRSVLSRDASLEQGRPRDELSRRRVHPKMAALTAIGSISVSGEERGLLQTLGLCQTKHHVHVLKRLAGSALDQIIGHAQ